MKKRWWNGAVNSGAELVTRQWWRAWEHSCNEQNSHALAPLTLSLPAGPASLTNSCCCCCCWHCTACPAGERRVQAVPQLAGYKQDQCQWQGGVQQPGAHAGPLTLPTTHTCCPTTWLPCLNNNKISEMKFLGKTSVLTLEKLLWDIHQRRLLRLSTESPH